jgi:hypothetical protein
VHSTLRASPVMVVGAEKQGLRDPIEEWNISADIDISFRTSSYVARILIGIVLRLIESPYRE